MPSSMRNEQWLALSNELANVIELLNPSIVAVHGGRRVSGSGMCWRPGLIVTASHTVRRADELSIILPDHISVPATLVGRDPTTDIALIKIEEAAGLSQIQA